MVKKISDEVREAVIISIKRYPDKLPQDIGVMHGVSTDFVRSMKAEQDKELINAAVKSKW